MKRFLSLFLALIVAVGVCCSAPMTIEAEAATFSDINQNNVFIKQAVGAPTCTLCATINMMRRTSMLRGDANWATLTEATVKSTAWISGTGLRGSFTYSNSANGIGSISVTSATLPGNSNNTSKLISLLAAHPEGIVIYNGTHAVLLTDYTDGVFYCNDPDDEQPVGRVNVSRAYSVKPTNATKYWYVSSPKVNIGGSSSGTTTPSVSAATITEDLYYLKNKSTGDYLSVSCSEDKNGADVSHWSKSEEFQVKIKKNSNGYEMWFPNVSSTRVVNQWGDVPAAGARITLYTHSGNKTQSWIFQSYSGGYLIRSAYNTNLFMTINSYGQVILDNFTGGSGQIWYLEKTVVKPSWAKLTASATDIPIGGSITFNASSDTGTKYCIGIDNDGERVLTNEFDGSITLKFNAAGSYSAYVTASNSAGYFDSARITLTVHDNYTVSYNANGGSGAPSSQTKVYGTNLTLSTTKPTRTGYTFKGWGTSTGDTSVNYNPGDTYKSNSSITLYAIWSANTYTVSYNVNGGTGCPSSQTKTYGKDLTLSSTKPTRSGYTFLGWGTSADDTSVNYNPGDTYKSNSSITLYAIWEIIKPDPPAAPVVKMSKTSFAVGESVTIYWDSVPGATSYWISGWKSSDHVINEPSTSLSKTVSFANAGTYSVAVSAKDAYGQQTLSEWVTFTVYKPYTVKYDANGGAGAPSSQTKKSTSDLTLSTTKPTRSGYTFKGWGTSASDTTVDYAQGATYSTNANITLYAVWQCNHTLGTTIVNAKEPTYTETGYTGDTKCNTCEEIIKTGTSVSKLTLGVPQVKIANTTSGINVSWNSVSGAEKYIVYRKTYNDSTKAWGGWETLTSNCTTT
ncbi:MAG: hypothetical protein E7556_08315, partial [Ruminococcaceae bacterium]|nr:hypothetical protein [Oscillospiraceae bacterium]